MSSLIDSLKSEIARVARKELKDELLALRKGMTSHRSEIAALKRQVKSLTSALKASIRASKGSDKAQASTPDTAPRIRFSAERFAAWRAKMGITQAQTAQLLEASALSVFKWESDKAQPRNAQLHRIAAVMKLGKREVLKRLQE
ncbi:transcriptional regulator [Rhodoferax saidenbachensis]|uniref:Transcriptional regulator n=1 Tax=Rhodoferax saidenbachensis TaxID=1484693 RepID=A0A1P8K6W4_9BURK|nr:transcriptional regulator [Rhodoferax saidenbachensis]APW41763.1 transcriptional regulator [Rhodoferax saidenbachensis]